MLADRRTFLTGAAFSGVAFLSGTNYSKAVDISPPSQMIDVSKEVSVAAAYAKNPKGLYFPPGDYMLPKEGLEIDSGAVWRGDRARLILPAGSTAPAIRTKRFAELKGSKKAEGPHGFVLDGLLIDANGGPYCAQLYGSGYQILGCDFIGWRVAGISSEWGEGGEIPMEAHIERFRVYGGYGTAGIEWAGPHDSTFVNGEVWTLEHGHKMDYAIRTFGNAIGERFIGVHTWGRHDVGYCLERETYLGMCTAEGAFEANVWFKAKNCQMIGGTIFHAGADVPTVGIRFGIEGAQSGVDSCEVNGVKMHNFHGNARPLHYANSWGNRVSIVLRSGGATALSSAWKGSPAGSDVIDIFCTDNPALSMVRDLRPRMAK